MQNILNSISYTKESSNVAFGKTFGAASRLIGGALPNILFKEK